VWRRRRDDVHEVTERVGWDWLGARWRRPFLLFWRLLGFFEDATPFGDDLAPFGEDVAPFGGDVAPFRDDFALGG
jgi:hypothetical protein